MKGKTGEWNLEEISRLVTGPVNEVDVVKNRSEPYGPLYTRVTVRDRDMAKRLLLLIAPGSPALRGEMDFICPGEEENLSFLFPYREERRLTRFYKTAGPLLSVAERLVMECMASPLPWAILYLTLSQDNVHLGREGEIYFSFDWDLERLDETKGEKECVEVLSAFVLKLLSEEKTRSSLKGLLERKRDRGVCLTLAALYRDITMDKLEPGKRGKGRLLRFWYQRRSRILRFIVAAGAVLFVLAVCMLVSQLLFGDFIGFRLFSHPFDHIGTETLT